CVPPSTGIVLEAGGTIRWKRHTGAIAAAASTTHTGRAATSGSSVRAASTQPRASTAQPAVARAPIRRIALASRTGWSKAEATGVHLLPSALQRGRGRNESLQFRTVAPVGADRHPGLT